MLPRHGVVPAIDRSACPSTRGHGTAHHRQVNGCRCPDGLDDARRHRYRAKIGLRFDDPTPVVFVDATGSMRRLRAAALAGWALPPISAASGHRTTTLSRIRRGIARYVFAETADDIRRTVDELLQQEPAPGTGRTHALRAAADGGWLPLDQWLPDEIDDPAALPDRDYQRGGHGEVRDVAVDDLLELAADHVLTDPATGTRSVDHAAVARRAGLDIERVTELLRHARSGPTLDDHDADLVDRIRAEYRAAEPRSFIRAQVAARHGVKAHVVDRALHGSTRNGYPDLVAELGPKWPTRANQPDDLTVHALRRDYAAGVAGTHVLARRYGVSQPTALRIVHGSIRPDLGLTDLTAARGDNSATASPAGRADRKENVA